MVCYLLKICLFRELSDYTEYVKIEWNLFESAVIASAAASCRCKRAGGQIGSENIIAWWNQAVKKAIRVKKTAFRVNKQVI